MLLFWECSSIYIYVLKHQGTQMLGLSSEQCRTRAAISGADFTLTKTITIKLN